MQNSENTAAVKKPSFTERLDSFGSRHNSGVDLLRLLCMFYVVSVHTISTGWGGIFQTAQPGTIQYLLCSLITAATVTCLDTFALISGFVGYSDKPKSVRITGVMKLYLHVVTVGVCVAVVFLIVRPDLVSVKDFIAPFFPITCNLYWYYTAYIGLFLVSPVLNAGLRHTPNRILRVMFVVMIAAFSVYSCACDRFKLEIGYSTVWLILLYIMGGIMKKCEIGKRIKPWMAFAGIAVLACVAGLWRAYGPEIGAFGVGIGPKKLVTLVSPMVLGASVLYIIAFSKLRCSRFWVRTAAFVSPSIFAVYLLNGCPLICDNLIVGRFAYLGTASPFKLVGTIFLFAAVFVTASILLDRVRVLAFDLLHIPQALSAIDRAAHNAVRKWIPND